MSTQPNPLATPLPWDLVSRAYATDLLAHCERYAREALRLVGARPGARILDVACGPGTLAVLAAAEASHVTALDFSPEMIGLLRERLAAGGITNVEAIVGDGLALPVADASFDAAFSMFGLMAFSDRERGLHEIHRALIPGGRVAISSWLPMNEVPLLAAVFAALRDRMPGLPQGDLKAPLGTAEEMRAELEGAGFHDAAAHRVAFALEYADPAAFTASMLRTLPPLVLLRNKLGEAAFEPIRKAIDARVADLAGPGPTSVTMAAWIGVATA